MKRKAMLMGMAVMAGMPGWATAKGSGKTVGGVHHYSDAPEARETLDAVEVIKEMPGLSETATGQGKAPALLARIKDMLGNANYGATTKPTADGSGWTLEFMAKPAGEVQGYADARSGSAAPAWVTFRYRF